MTGIDYFSLFVLVVLFATVIVGWILLAMLPGRIATKNNHPQAQAINIGGWLGAIFGGVFWPVILVWSLTKSPTILTADSITNADLVKQNEELKERISALEADIQNQKKRK